MNKNDSWSLVWNLPHRLSYQKVLGHIHTHRKWKQKRKCSWMFLFFSLRYFSLLLGAEVPLNVRKDQNKPVIPTLRKGFVKSTTCSLSREIVIPAAAISASSLITSPIIPTQVPFTRCPYLPSATNFRLNEFESFELWRYPSGLPHSDLEKIPCIFPCFFYTY